MLENERGGTCGCWDREELKPKLKEKFVLKKKRDNALRDWNWELKSEIKWMQRTHKAQGTRHKAQQAGCQS